MRFLYPLILIIVLGVVLLTVYKTDVQADPKETASIFLDAVRAGNYKKAVEEFGGNACRCPAKGGWVSYLIYSSSQEPNLAFATGHPFSYKLGKSTPIESSDEAKKGVVLWQTPQDVVIDARVSFDSKEYMPVFLPVFMAYGKEMTEGQFNEFLTDPDKEAWKGFTLRFRPSLEKGAIERPEASRGIKYNPTFKAKDSKSKGEEDKEAYVYAPLEKMIKETLGEEGVLYLHPRDPGKVVKEDGSALASQEVLEKLPRLKSFNLRLHVVRRAQIKKWTVYHFALTEPELILENGKSLRLKNYRPRYGDEGWNRTKKRKSS